MANFRDKFTSNLESSLASFQDNVTGRFLNKSGANNVISALKEVLNEVDSLQLRQGEDDTAKLFGKQIRSNKIIEEVFYNKKEVGAFFSTAIKNLEKLLTSENRVYKKQFDGIAVGLNKPDESPFSKPSTPFFHYEFDREASRDAGVSIKSHKPTPLREFTKVEMDKLFNNNTQKNLATERLTS